MAAEGLITKEAAAVEAEELVPQGTRQVPLLLAMGASQLSKEESVSMTQVPILLEEAVVTEGHTS